ncbi:MAG: hypothetical protein Q9227_003757 [Pyrenula ochraceoflavens]
MSKIRNEVEVLEKGGSQGDQETHLKKTKDGIVLVPQPSDDPRDPLNWPMWKKILTISIVSLAAFIGLGQSIGGQSGFVVQGEVYGKTPIEMSYSISATAVGLAVGPLIWAPLSQYIGRTSVIFWGMLLTLLCCVWSAEMTSPDQYIPFVLSRWLAGLFGSTAAAIGAHYIMDLFFIHQRGRVFAAYALCGLFGTQVGPTVGGFILNSHSWPWMFWWTVGVEAGVLLLTLFLLEEPVYHRATLSTPSPTSYLPRRLATLFPGTRVAYHNGHHPLSSLFIGLCPVTLLTGGFLLIAFGWAVAVTTLLPVFLQTPTSQGGYGFTPTQNAYFFFSQWIGIALAFAYGTLCNDRVALFMCQRYGRGLWKPEYRLFPMFVPPAVLLPSMLGLFGAALQYRWHYMVLAVATAGINFCETAMTPLIYNYTVECFTEYPAEVNSILNFYRLVLGLGVPFFVEAWADRVTVGWVFGMMGFFVLIGFGFLGVLVVKGEEIRALSWGRLGKDEGGVKLKVDEGERNRNRETEKV